MPEGQGTADEIAHDHDRREAYRVPEHRGVAVQLAPDRGERAPELVGRRREFERSGADGTGSTDPDRPLAVLLPTRPAPDRPVATLIPTMPAPDRPVTTLIPTMNAPAPTAPSVSPARRVDHVVQQSAQSAGRLVGRAGEYGARRRDLDGGERLRRQFGRPSVADRVGRGVQEGGSRGEQFVDAFAGEAGAGDRGVGEGAEHGADLLGEPAGAVQFGASTRSRTTGTAVCSTQRAGSTTTRR
ncbi:hypothetical protein ABT367_39535, partial [Streptomyces mesophilus]